MAIEETTTDTFADPDDPSGPVVPAHRARLVGRCGIAAVASGALVLFALTVPAVRAVNALGVLGLAASVAPVVAFVVLQAAGRGFGKTALATWTVAYTLLVASFVLSALLWTVGASLALVGSLIALPSALLLVFAGPIAGIAIARAELLTGWRRWTPVCLAVTQVLAMLPGLGIALPIAPLIVFFPVMLVLTGVALLTLPGVRPSRAHPAPEV